MQIDAIYEDGRLVFDPPLQFTQGRFAVRVELPDDVLGLAPAVTGTDEQGRAPESAAGADWLQRLESLRAEALASDGPDADLPSQAPREEG